MVATPSVRRVYLVNKSEQPINVSLAYLRRAESTDLCACPCKHVFGCVRACVWANGQVGVCVSAVNKYTPASTPIHPPRLHSPHPHTNMHTYMARVRLLSKARRMSITLLFVDLRTQSSINVFVSLLRNRWHAVSGVQDTRTLDGVYSNFMTVISVTMHLVKILSYWIRRYQV